MTSSTEVWSLTAHHGDDLDADDFAALQTIRRTLLGLLDHGVITELNTYSRPDLTAWSYRPGSEEPDHVLAGVLHTARVIAPEDWILESSPMVGP